MIDYIKKLRDYTSTQECLESSFYKRVMRKRQYSTRNHDLLQFALNNDLDVLYSDYKLYKIRACYYNDEDNIRMFNLLDHEIQEFNDLYDCNLAKLFDCFFRNQFRKLDRVRNYVYRIQMLDDDEYGAYFCTLTLDDSNYFNADTITRDEYSSIRSKVRREIAEYSDVYVFNKDFGLNESKRLHFHGVALLKRTQVDSFKCTYSRKFGFCKIDPIRNNPDYVCEYINKLTKHALKVNYGFNKENFIYSREKH